MTNEDLRESGSSADDRPEGNAPIPETSQVRVEPKEKAQQAEPEDRSGWIPRKAHDSEKSRRRKAEQEAAQLRGYLTAYQQQMEAMKAQPQQPASQSQPQQPLPDWYTDPEAAWSARYQQKVQPEIGEIRKQIEEFQKKLQGTPREVLYETSRMVANGIHGEDAVKAAHEALDSAMKADPRLDAEIKARLMASSDPYGEIVRWHKQQADKGVDVDAEVERRVAERLQQYGGGQAPMQPYAPQQSQYPSNFANSRNAGGKTNGAWGGPKPLNEIFSGR
jgi:hypothetical protein